MTTARYGGRLSALRTGRFYPQEYSWYSFSLRAESTPGPCMVWSEGNMSLKNPVTTPGIDPGTVRLVAQRLNHYATPGPKRQSTDLKFISTCFSKCHGSLANTNMELTMQHRGTSPACLGSISVKCLLVALSVNGTNKTNTVK